MISSRRTHHTILGAALALSVSIAFCFVLPHLSNEYERYEDSRDLMQCRVNITRLVSILAASMRENGWLPFDSEISGEVLFCRLDCLGLRIRCPAGAPDDGHGGYQMLNVSGETWTTLLERADGAVIPILWCGRSHTNSYGREMRHAIVIDNGHGVHLSMLKRNLRGEKVPYVQLDGSGRYVPVSQASFHKIPEGDFVRSIAMLNEILEDLNVAPIELNSSSRRDYWELARPHQSK